MYVSSYFTMVPPCLVSCTSIFSLVGPAWAYCPASLISPFSSLFTPFLPSSPSSHLVSHCHFVLGSSLSLASLYVLSQLSPFWGQPGHIVRLVPPLSPLLTIFSISSSTSLSSLPSFLFSSLQVFAQSGFAQCGNTSMWSLAAMSCAYLRWCAHVLPPLSHTPPMLMVPPTLLAACRYLTLWSLGTLLHNILRALIQGFLSLLPFSPLEALLI